MSLVVIDEVWGDGGAGHTRLASGCRLLGPTLQQYVPGYQVHVYWSVCVCMGPKHAY